ncbi:MAG: hypothetical protein HQL90_13135 [Magnetococcales bacterium]|nr:hypothetical protein [Magnetococcales bacterium]
MKNLLRHLFSFFWSLFWSAIFVLLTGFTPSPMGATDAPSEKELATMGQGFGKFVGSFMRQVQSDDGKRAPVAEDRHVAEPPPPSRQDRGVEPPVRGGQPGAEAVERRYVPYRLYDPWGANRWGDPVLGFDPWAQGGGWVDHDWNARKQQYGWSYGGVAPVYRGEGYVGGEYPYSGGEEPYLGGETPLRERPWSAPYGGGWNRGRHDGWPPPPPEEGYGYYSRPAPSDAAPYEPPYERRNRGYGGR